jgi:hypothetical protein
MIEARVREEAANEMAERMARIDLVRERSV